MARKIDRYGRNRQFRRNPTRSPKFFPYQLPFQPDFRLLSNTGTEISAESAARWRQVVADITNRNKRKHEYDSDSGDGYYGPYTPSQNTQKKIRNEFAIAALESALMAEMPPTAIPIAGFEILRDPKRASHMFGGSTLAGVGLAGYLSAKSLI